MATGERAVRDLLAAFGRADCVAANNDRVLVTADEGGAGWVVWGWRDGVRASRPEVFAAAETLIAALAAHGWLDGAHDRAARHARYAERDGPEAGSPRLWRSLG